MKCCERDYNEDGNCDIHRAPGVDRRSAAYPSHGIFVDSESGLQFVIQNYRPVQCVEFPEVPIEAVLSILAAARAAMPNVHNSSILNSDLRPKIRIPFEGSVYSQFC